MGFDSWVQAYKELVIGNSQISFLATCLLVSIPMVLILFLYIGLFGKPIPDDVCSYCSQKFNHTKEMIY